jgi:hypothetical protein
MFPGATFTPPAFFEPLSSQELEAWDGGADRGAPRVAEKRESYGAKRDTSRKPKERR